MIPDTIPALLGRIQKGAKAQAELQLQEGEMIHTVLVDGRCVMAPECFERLENALIGPTGTMLDHPEIYEDKKNGWHITCQCCGGSGEHAWSPSGHLVDPNGGDYQCGPCKGVGQFEIRIP